MVYKWKQWALLSHKNLLHRRWKDTIVLISVLNVTFIKLCKSDIGCHCPDGDGIWWKRSGRCTQSKQQPAKCSCEYNVISVPYCYNSLFNWFFSLLNWLMFWSVIKPNCYWRWNEHYIFCASFKLYTQLEYKGFGLLKRNSACVRLRLIWLG